MNTEAVGSMAADVDVSVIVLVSERPQDLRELYREFSAPLAEAGYAAEFVFISGPFYGELLAPLVELSRAGEPIRVVEVAQTFGDAALLKIAVERCRGGVLLILPAYRRVDAAVLPQLVARVEDGTDMAVARRWPRIDSWINKLQSRYFHALLGGVTRGRIHDVACGVAAVRRQVIEELPLYGDFYRFLPIVALREGYVVEEVAAPQHRLDSQPRVYAPGVYVRRLLDVLGVYFLFRFTEKPLRFFGLLGTSLGAAGMVTLLLLFGQKVAGQGIANRPMLLLGVLLIVLGAQAVALGLIGEIVVHLHAPNRKPYRLRDDRAASTPRGVVAYGPVAAEPAPLALDSMHQEQSASR